MKSSYFAKLHEFIHVIKYWMKFSALWENFCIAERLKFLHYNHLQINSYFWRTYSQREIDYIEEAEGKYKAYEIKWQTGKKKQACLRSMPSVILIRRTKLLLRIILQTGFL